MTDDPIITERGQMSPSGQHWIGASGTRYPLTDNTRIDTRDRVPAYVEQLSPAARIGLDLDAQTDTERRMADVDRVIGGLRSAITRERRIHRWQLLLFSALAFAAGLAIGAAL